MTGLNEAPTDAPLAERNPYRATEDAADRLNRQDRAFNAEARHDSRCALNGAGTDETMETSHSVVAHVPRDRARDFERAARDVVDLGIEVTERSDSNRGDRKRFVLRPPRSDDGRERSSGIDEL